MHLFAPFYELMSWSSHARGERQRKSTMLPNQPSSAGINTFLPSTQFKTFTCRRQFRCRLGWATGTMEGDRDQFWQGDQILSQVKNSPWARVVCTLLGPGMFATGSEIQGQNQGQKRMEGDAHATLRCCTTSCSMDFICAFANPRECSFPKGIDWVCAAPQVHR